MRRPSALLGLAFALASLSHAFAGAETGNAAERCAAALERSLDLLEDGPLLKEELATAIMWMRLDAEASRDAGDHGTCARSAGTAESLLRGHREGNLEAQAN